MNSTTTLLVAGGAALLLFRGRAGARASSVAPWTTDRLQELYQARQAAGEPSPALSTLKIVTVLGGVGLAAARLLKSIIKSDNEPVAERAVAALGQGDDAFEAGLTDALESVGKKVLKNIAEEVLFGESLAFDVRDPLTRVPLSDYLRELTLEPVTDPAAIVFDLGGVTDGVPLVDIETHAADALASLPDPLLGDLALPEVPLTFPPETIEAAQMGLDAALLDPTLLGDLPIEAVDQAAPVIDAFLTAGASPEAAQAAAAAGELPFTGMMPTSAADWLRVGGTIAGLASLGFSLATAGPQGPNPIQTGAAVLAMFAPAAGPAAPIVLAIAAILSIGGGFMGGLFGVSVTKPNASERSYAEGMAGSRALQSALRSATTAQGVLARLNAGWSPFRQVRVLAFSRPLDPGSMVQPPVQIDPGEGSGDPLYERPYTVEDLLNPVMLATFQGWAGEVGVVHIAWDLTREIRAALARVLRPVDAALAEIAGNPLVVTLLPPAYRYMEIGTWAWPLLPPAKRGVPAALVPVLVGYDAATGEPVYQYQAGRPAAEPPVAAEADLSQWDPGDEPLLALTDTAAILAESRRLRAIRDEKVRQYELMLEMQADLLALSFGLDPAAWSSGDIGLLEEMRRF